MFEYAFCGKEEDFEDDIYQTAFNIFSNDNITRE